MRVANMPEAEPSPTPGPTPTPQPYPAPTATPTAYEGIFSRFVAFLNDLFEVKAVSAAPLLNEVPIGEVYFLLSDHLRSTTMTLNLDGSVKSEMRYDAWGKTRYTSGTTPTERHYTGQIEESGFGLYFYNARWYDSALGRFVQADTIIPQPGSPQGWDRYAYANNNPLSYTDPSGHLTWFVTGAIGAGIGAIIGGVTYSLTNPVSFNSGEFWTAVGAGAVSGALLGSGLGLISAVATTASAATGAAMMVGAGSASAITEMDYMISDPGNFDSSSFVQSAAISGAVGGISSICPMTPLGVASKGWTYIAGAEVQYAVQASNWSVEGAQQAAIDGIMGAAFDVGVNGLINSIFMMNNPIMNVYPEKLPRGLLSQGNVLPLAAQIRAQVLTSGAIGNIVSGFGAPRTNIKSGT